MLLVLSVLHSDDILLRREIEREAGLIMAIPEKRMLGTWGLWLGILVFAQLGFVLVPRDKVARAKQALTATINSKLSFEDYRSLCGLLEHVRHALRMPKRVMHGLYFPHGPHGESKQGPSTLVHPNFFMATQLNNWCLFLASRAGSFFTAALSRTSLPAATPATATLRRLGCAARRAGRRPHPVVAVRARGTATA